MGEKIESKHFMDLECTQCTLLYISNVATNTHHASYTLTHHNDIVGKHLKMKWIQKEIQMNGILGMVDVRCMVVLCFSVCRCFYVSISSTFVRIHNKEHQQKQFYEKDAPL